MSFEQVNGNNRAIERLKDMIRSKNISHAYIFESDPRVDKKSAAEIFIKAILCENSTALFGDCCDCCDSCRKIDHGNHEDVIYLKKDGNHLKDEEIENLQARLKKKPYVGNRTAVIIEDADTMTLRAQNRLLKTLEEPPIGTVLLLLSENVENLVATIRSRCILIRFAFHQTKQFQEAFSAARMVETMLLEKRPFYEIIKELPQQTDGTDAAQLFLDALEGWYRDIAISDYDEKYGLLLYEEYADEIREKSKLYQKDKLFHAIANIEEAKKDLNRNINMGYTLKNMILKIGG